MTRKYNRKSKKLKKQKMNKIRSKSIRLSRKRQRTRRKINKRKTKRKKRTYKKRKFLMKGGMMGANEQIRSERPHVSFSLEILEAVDLSDKKHLQYFAVSSVAHPMWPWKMDAQQPAQDRVVTNLETLQGSRALDEPEKRPLILEPPLREKMVKWSKEEDEVSLAYAWFAMEGLLSLLGVEFNDLKGSWLALLVNKAWTMSDKGSKEGKDGSRFFRILLAIVSVSWIINKSGPNGEAGKKLYNASGRLGGYNGNKDFILEKYKQQLTEKAVAANEALQQRQEVTPKPSQVPASSSTPATASSGSQGSGYSMSRGREETIENRAAKATAEIHADSEIRKLMKDQGCLVRTLIEVPGHGRGKYVSFKKNHLGANNHTIMFSTGEATVNLKGLEWKPKLEENPPGKWGFVLIGARPGQADTEPEPEPEPERVEKILQEMQEQADRFNEMKDKMEKAELNPEDMEALAAILTKHTEMGKEMGKEIARLARVAEAKGHAEAAALLRQEPEPK